MKNENKYYTPEVNELFVGYKCEYIYSDESDVYKETELDSSDIYHFDEQVRNKLDTYQIRTKYLDTEDIENLGFKKFNYPFYNNTNEINATKEKIKIKNYYDDKVEIELRLKYDTENNHIVLDNNEEYDLCVTFFEGEVKSLNELTKILKMICY